MSCSPAVVPLLTTRFLFLDRGFHGASRGCKGLHGPQGHWFSGVSWGVGVSGGIGCGSIVDGVRGPAGDVEGIAGPERAVGGIRGWQGVSGIVGDLGDSWVS